MTRAAAIAAAETYFDEGGFTADLARRVAIPTESQVAAPAPVLAAYLADEIAPTLKRLGFESQIFDNPCPRRADPDRRAAANRARRRPRWAMVMATSFAGSSRNGMRACRRGN